MKKTIRKKPTFLHELSLWEKGFRAVVGIDEVGRGAFAGPVVAAGVIFSPFKTFINTMMGEINDSKLVSPKKRLLLSDLIKKEALSFATCEVNVETINTIGIGRATQQAFQQVVSKLSITPDFCLLDAFPIETIEKTKQKAIIHGDMLSISIAAASIIAKVYRDNLMENIHKQYDVYDFASNKGYGTAYHRKAIKTYGLTSFHRIAFCD